MRQQTQKRKVTFSSNNEQAINYIMEGDEFKHLFYNITVDAISQNYQKDQCVLFNVPNISNDVIIKKNHYQNALKEATNYFISKEDYQKCSQIRDLITKL
jgi:hypothetical protein